MRQRDFKNDSLRRDAANISSGEWFQKYSAQADIEERDEYLDAAPFSGKMLDQFIREDDKLRQVSQDEEEDDDDIYTRY